MSNEYLNNKFLEKAIARFQRSKRERTMFESALCDGGSYPDKIARKTSPGEEPGQVCGDYEKTMAEYAESQATLATAFYTLSENIVKYANFNLIDSDDAIQEGVMICFEKIDRFNPEIGKAFNYMTTCVLNHFRQLYRTARNYNELKKKYHDFLQSQNQFSIQIMNRNKKFSSITTKAEDAH